MHNAVYGQVFRGEQSPEEVVSVISATPSKAMFILIDLYAHRRTGLEMHGTFLGDIH